MTIVGGFMMAAMMLLSQPDGMPDTFAACVSGRGEVSAHTGWLTCREVRMSEMRIYGEGLNDEGTPVPIEIWTSETMVSITRAWFPGETEVRELDPESESFTGGQVIPHVTPMVAT